MSTSGRPARAPGAAASSAAGTRIEEGVVDCHQTEDVLDEWEETWVEVLHVRFSQEQIHPFFHKRGPIQDILNEVTNRPCEVHERADREDPLAPTVRIELPFEPIRCVRCTGVHSDLISLDNRRLYALQLAAVERWPARCVAPALVAKSSRPRALLAEAHKLEAGGLGPLGEHAGKPRALLEHACGDSRVLVASRGSTWAAWHAAAAVLERCRGAEGAGELAAAAAAALPGGAVPVAGEARAACEAALQAAEAALAVERESYSVLEDLNSVVEHAAALRSLLESLEVLRLAAAAASGFLVRRVGVPGDRDGYISVTAQASALRCMVTSVQ